MRKRPRLVPASWVDVAFDEVDIFSLSIESAVMAISQEGNEWNTDRDVNWGCKVVSAQSDCWR